MFMGMTIGVVSGHTYEAMEHRKRPTITDSVAGQDNEDAKGFQITDSINVRLGHLGFEDESKEAQ